MYCAVKVIDREGRGTLSCFQYNTFDFYQELRHYKFGH